MSYEIAMLQCPPNPRLFPRNDQTPQHPRCHIIPVADIDFLRGHPFLNTPKPSPMAPDQRPPETLPDPWLFDTEKLLRELARCREMILLIPATDAAAHFAINIAVNANWNLEQHLRSLLAIHGEGQRAWQRRAALSERQKQRNDSRPAVRPVHARRSANAERVA